MTREEEKEILTAIRTAISMCDVSRKAKNEANKIISKVLVKKINNEGKDLLNILQGSDNNE